jgi:energy-coupling factor transport system substrate-specific component
VTWQLAAFAILAVALAGGFAWYERARPDARIVALVATLAAFAALGRIAFAALPNIKPTTDIVLVSGYALGGGPGFAVGAIAGLTSNFFFGQGPWTPWQMAAWGATGMLGAGLAIVTRKRISRWPLALVCCAVGFVFTVIQDFGDWVTYSSHSLRALTAYVGTGLGFDVIDAVGCLVFALAFGPALLRSIERFARRIQVSWGPPGGVLPLLVVMSLAALGAGAVRPSAANAAAGSPAGYLLGAQNQDGGFGAAPGEPSSTLYSGWVALGLAGVGRNPATVAHGGPSLLEYIETHPANDPGSIERTILVARAADVSATDFGGHNLVRALDRDIRPNGSVAGQANLTAFAVLALRAAGATVPSSTIQWLAGQEDKGGGFSFATAGDEADVDDTGAVLEALRGAAPAATRAAVAYIRAAQNRDGGFPSEPGGDSDAQSTAWAVQGLIAVGTNPSTVHVRGGHSPLQYLASVTTSSGAVDYARGTPQTPVWVTAEAIMGIDEKPLPLSPVPRPAAAAHHPAVKATTTTRPSPHHAAAARRSAVHAAPASPRHRHRRAARRSAVAVTSTQPTSAPQSATVQSTSATAAVHPNSQARHSGGGGFPWWLVAVIVAACGAGLLALRATDLRIPRPGAGR